MWKRVIAGLLGTIAMLAGAIFAAYALEIFRDFFSASVEFWSNVLGTTIMLALALIGLWLGFRFLNFAMAGERYRPGSKASAVLTGLAFFLPGSIFPLLLTALVVRLWWPNGENHFRALIITCVAIGIAAAIACMIWLLRKSRLHSEKRSF
jgi:hypothetical protein